MLVKNGINAYLGFNKNHTYDKYYADFVMKEILDKPRAQRRSIR